MDVSTLRAQHTELEGLATTLYTLVSSEERQSVAVARWRLARALIAHLAVEDRYVYPALAKSEDPATAALARSFKDEMGHLADTFSGYMARWTDQAIIDNWPAYCAESKAVLDVLFARMERENRELYPLAAAGLRGPT